MALSILDRAHCQVDIIENIFLITSKVSILPQRNGAITSLDDKLTGVYKFRVLSIGTINHLDHYPPLRAIPEGKMFEASVLL